MRTGLFFILVFGCCAWLSKEDRACDPTRGNIHRFTGFKISKELLIQGIFPPKFLRHIIFTNCVDGRINFQKRSRITRDLDEMWKLSFCASNGKLLASAENGTPAIIPELTNVNSNNRRKVFDRVFRLLDGRFRERSEVARVSTLVSSQQLKQLRDFDYPICYKMARRKVFAKKNLSYYMPLTFVGGLFSYSGNTSYSGSRGEKSIGQNYTFARPEMPLVAEDTTSQWIELKLLHLAGPSLKQIIPLFSSTKPRNFPFPFADVTGLTLDSWAENLDANEDYQYSELDASTISQSLAATADLIHKLVYPISLDFLLSAVQVGLDSGSPDEPAGFESDSVNRLATALSPEDLMGFALVPLLPLSGESRNVLGLLMRIQNLWSASRYS